MAKRVTQEEVKQIITTTLADISAFLTAANLMTNRIAAGCGTDLDEETLKEVERWYSAHLISVQDPVLVKEKFENAENTYQRGSMGSNASDGVLSTQYGQQANTLSGGCLAREDQLKQSVCFF